MPTEDIIDTLFDYLANQLPQIRSAHHDDRFLSAIDRKQLEMLRVVVAGGVASLKQQAIASGATSLHDQALNVLFPHHRTTTP